MRGHLNTDGLDPVTARAVELLVAADVVAAEQYRKIAATATTTTVTENMPRRWRDPGFFALMCGLVCAVLLSLGYIKIAHQSADVARQTEGVHTLQQQNHTLLSEIHSCTSPDGACTRRGARAQREAIDEIIRRMVAASCASQASTAAQVRHCIRVSRAASESAARQ